MKKIHTQLPSGALRRSVKRDLQNSMVVKVDGLVRIPLTQGKWAVIDEEDWSLVKAYKWYAKKDYRTFYARSKITNDGKKVTIMMHRLILGLKKSEIADHRNGDGLNNRRLNLRKCTASDNSKNCRKRSDNSSGFKGVYSMSNNRFKSAIRVNGKELYNGTFATPEEAAIAYNKQAIKYHGEFASLNKL